MKVITIQNTGCLRHADIHAGEQAEIVFTLVGEPPFTFTYQRAEPIAKKGGKLGKVLETHTVSGVTTHEYSIFSAIEGVFLPGHASDDQSAWLTWTSLQVHGQ